MEHLKLAEGKAVTKLSLPEQFAGELSDYRVHPVLLDAALQTIAVCHGKRTETNECGDALWLFCGLDHLRVTRAGASRLTCHAVSEAVGEVSTGIFRGSAQLYDESGLLVAEIEGARFQRATRESLLASDEANPADLLFEVAWRPWCGPSHALQREAADYLPTLQQIEERLEVDLAGQSHEDDEAAAEVISGFHRLGAQYLSPATFQELRWNPASRRPIRGAGDDGKITNYRPARAPVHPNAGDSRRGGPGATRRRRVGKLSVRGERALRAYDPRFAPSLSRLSRGTGPV